MASAPDTNTTLPFGLTLEEMALVVQENQVLRLVSFASVAILFYDHAITFDYEVEKIWALRWRVPKTLFVLNRYLTPLLITFQYTIEAVYGLPDSVCYSYVYWQELPPRIALLIAELLIMIRVSAIYGHNRIISGLLIVAFLCEFGILTAFVTLGVKASSFDPSTRVLPLPGCLVNIVLFSSWNFPTATWIVPIVFESVIIALTLYKISPWGSSNPVSRLIARDSLIYFICIFALSIANVVLYETPGSYPPALLIGPSTAAACIAVTRMMLNLGAIPLDDPSGMHLTLDGITFRHPTTLYEDKD